MAQHTVGAQEMQMPPLKPNLSLSTHTSGGRGAVFSLSPPPVTLTLVGAERPVLTFGGGVMLGRAETSNAAEHSWADRCGR